MKNKIMWTVRYKERKKEDTTDAATSSKVGGRIIFFLFLDLFTCARELVQMKLDSAPFTNRPPMSRKGWYWYISSNQRSLWTRCPFAFPPRFHLRFPWRISNNIVQTNRSTIGRWIIVYRATNSMLVRGFCLSFI